MNIEKVNLNDKFEKIIDFWSPGIVGKLNGQLVKLAKLKGDFVWHKHDEEDELFLVIKGTLNILLEEKTIKLNEGEFVIIPKGVLHKPVAEQEVKILLFEPETTINTGNLESDLTYYPKQI